MSTLRRALLPACKQIAPLLHPKRPHLLPLRCFSTISISPRFTVRRQAPILVAPSEPTAHEFKPLSDIDDQTSLRYHVRLIHYYRHDPSMRGQDPVRVVRDALAKALVLYYPLAGRLREGKEGKLVMECTGEGVPFIEADADVRLDQLGDGLPAPVPCLDELLYDVPGWEGVIGCPVLLIQVTRLACGGVIFAIRLNHTAADGPGLVQFLTAMCEIANGASAPTVRPLWGRDLFNARIPPQVAHPHREFERVDTDTDANMHFEPNTIVHRSFFFGEKEVSALKHNLLLPRCSTFDVITASTWRSRTAAVGLADNDEVRLMFIVNARGRMGGIVPVGYYGNAFVYPVAITTAGELCRRPLEYAVKLVRDAKKSVTLDYIRSTVDVMAARGRPAFSMRSARQTYFVSDNTGSGFDKLNFGWGKPVFGGPAVTGFDAIPGVLSYYVRFKDSKGEEGVVVPMSLPEPEMERFVAEMERLIGGTTREPHKYYQNVFAAVAT